MKKFNRIVIPALALLVFLAAVPSAQAFCPNVRQVTQYNPVAGTIAYTYGIQTYGAYGSWWALGYGDPVVGSGHDNGAYGMFYAGYCGYPLAGVCYSYPDLAWMFSYVSVYPNVSNFNASWAATTVDGCIDLTGAECMGMMISDEDPAGTTGYFLMTTKIRDGFFNYDWSTTPLSLVPIPAPAITGSVNGGATSVSVTVACPAVPMELDPGCPAAVQTGCRVYSRQLAGGSAPPSGRQVELWTNASVAPVAAGAAETVTITCPGTGTTDVYLATALIFDSGYETKHVSGNSARVECGPIIADPGRRLDTNIPARQKPKRGRGR